MKLQKYQSDLDGYYDQRIKDAKRSKEEPPVPYKPNDDGEFLMNFSDWTSMFNNLFTGLTFRDD